jgi:large subunit ribosomal protein L5
MKKETNKKSDLKTNIKMNKVPEKKNKTEKTERSVEQQSDNKSYIDKKIICRLKNIYDTDIITKIMKEKNYNNIHQVGKITKIVLTSCLGDYFHDEKAFTAIRHDFETIGLQKSVVIAAKQSIAAFHLREGMKIAYKITLRKKRMYYFLDRLINLVFILNREFKGISHKTITGNKKGSFAFSFGIKDISDFPEVEKTSLSKLVGIGITICTNTKTKKDCQYLLEQFNFPFMKGEK